MGTNSTLSQLGTALAKCADFEVIGTTSAMGSSVSAWTLFPSFGHGFPKFGEASEEGRDHVTSSGIRSRINDMAQGTDSRWLIPGSLKPYQTLFGRKGQYRAEPRRERCHAQWGDRLPLKSCKLPPHAIRIASICWRAFCSEGMRLAPRCLRCAIHRCNASFRKIARLPKCN